MSEIMSGNLILAGLRWRRNGSRDLDFGQVASCNFIVTVLGIPISNFRLQQDICIIYMIPSLLGRSALLTDVWRARAYTPR